MAESKMYYTKYLKYKKKYIELSKFIGGATGGVFTTC